MNQPHDLNVTADIPASSAPPDSLDAGLAAGFGRPMAPRSSLGELRPVLLKEAEGESEHIVKPKSDAMPPKEQTGDRYQLSGEIARGGMGAVLRGRDVDLGRDLAVKVLLEKYANRPEVARRFIEEAQIGGQLQHPGVVPVYDIGKFGDRPFFTMKLVKGHTLAALLEERVSRKDAKNAKENQNEAENLAILAALRETLPRFLNIALKVSETLAYAHAKGVIHRDLKPANIMVGAFGEVQVMDWGLAKVLAEGGIADEERAASRERERPVEGTQIRTARSSGSAGSYGTDTEAGSLLGTPAYMPPEQANGDIAHLDRRADAFGLGAILCEILTGKPPYVGRSHEEVRRKAANGDLADAMVRLDTCGADAELIALTKKCLSPEAIDRPKDAQEVTDGLSAYLNGVQKRLQTAERERAVAVVREAEQRKKRRVQLALAAAVVGLLMGGGAFAFWRAEQAQAGRERDARNGEAVASLLGQTEDALKAGDAQKAEVVLEAARNRSAEGGAEKKADRLKRLDADLALLRDLDAVDQFRWTWDENKFPDVAVVATRTREALKRFGADPEVVSVDEAAARVSDSVVHERIVAALDRLLRLRRKAEARALLRQLDADPYRDAVRDAVLGNDGAKLAELADQKDALQQPPGFAAFLGDCQEIGVERRRTLLQRAVSSRPGNVALLMQLGSTYSPFLRGQRDTLDEQVRWYQAAVAAAPDNLAALGNLGNSLAKKGDVDGAIASFHKVIELDPKSAIAHNNLGYVLFGQGKVDEAIGYYHKAIELDPQFAQAQNNLGNSLYDKGDVDGAIVCYRKALELNPKNASAHTNLGIGLKAKDQLDDAIASYRKAVELDPKYAHAHTSLGHALKAKDRVDDAIACYRKAIELDPKDARPHLDLGNALADNSDLDGAIACFKKAIELDPNYPEAHCNVGHALARQGQYADSLPFFERGHELGSKQRGWRFPSAMWVQRVKQIAGVEAKLSVFLKGDFKPTTNDVRLALVELCQIKKLHHAVAGLYAAAFSADPKLADDLKFGHRYNAACSAALAAAGHCEDARKLDAKERTRMRRLAVDWLKADLALWTKKVESGNPADLAAVQQTLHHWQKDADLATLRDASLAKLPADEQKALTQLWADVAALLKKAEGK